MSTRDPMLAAALDYAARGFPVFPIYELRDGRCSCSDSKCGTGRKPSGKPTGSPGKHPRTKRGWKDSTTDPKQIRRWWADWPGAFVGIDTRGLIVLDDDPLDGGDVALAALVEQYGPLPETPTVRTGSGGGHRYFRAPLGGVRCSASKLGPGLDVRGDGGYVVAPPSGHYSGGRYEWLHDLDARDLAPAPEWLVELTRKDEREVTAATAPPRPRRTTNRTTSTGRGLLAYYDEKLADPSDGRKGRLMRAAYALGGWAAGGVVTDADAVDVLERGAAACGLTADDPRYVARTIQGSMAKGALLPRYADPLPPEPTIVHDANGRWHVRFGEAAQEALEPADELPPAQTVPLEGATDAMLELLPSIRHEDRPSIFDCTAGAGKTTVALDLAAESPGEFALSSPNHQLLDELEERARARGIPVHRIVGVQHGCLLPKERVQHAIARGWGRCWKRMACGDCEFRRAPDDDTDPACPVWHRIPDGHLLLLPHAAEEFVPEDVRARRHLFRDEEQEHVQTVTVTSVDLECAADADLLYTADDAERIAFEAARDAIRSFLLPLVLLAREETPPAHRYGIHLGPERVRNWWESTRTDADLEHLRLAISKGLDIFRRPSGERMRGPVSGLADAPHGNQDIPFLLDALLHVVASDTTPDAPRLFVVTGPRPPKDEARKVALEHKRRTPSPTWRSTVILDATARYAMPEYRARLGDDVELHRLEVEPAPDAEIHRLFIEAAPSTLSARHISSGYTSTENGRRVLGTILERAAEEAERVYGARPVSMPILTREKFAAALRAATGDHADAEPELRAVLEERGDRLRVTETGHYGKHERGWNGLEHADALLLLGSPVPNLAAVERDCIVLGLAPDGPPRLEPDAPLHPAVADAVRRRTDAALEQGLARLRAERGAGRRPSGDGRALLVVAGHRRPPGAAWAAAPTWSLAEARDRALEAQQEPGDVRLAARVWLAELADAPVPWASPLRVHQALEELPGGPGHPNPIDLRVRLSRSPGAARKAIKREVAAWAASTGAVRVEARIPGGFVWALPGADQARVRADAEAWDRRRRGLEPEELPVVELVPAAPPVRLDPIPDAALALAGMAALLPVEASDSALVSTTAAIAAWWPDAADRASRVADSWDPADLGRALGIALARASPPAWARAG